MSKVETRFKSLMLISLIMVVINVGIGALLTFYLDFTSNVFAVIIGTVILLQGMFYLIRYLYDGLGKKVFAIVKVYFIEFPPMIILTATKEAFNKIQNCNSLKL